MVLNPKPMSNPESLLPPGFRFHPTDEELILHYLKNKATSNPCPVSIIAEVDIYKFDPWDLPAKASFGETEWYFFSPRDRKYPNGARPNRAAASGYWKATGTDKPILRTGQKEHIGVKKALVFYKGRPPKGIKTNWIMHEYRLAQLIKNYKPMKFKDSSMRLDDWVLCRIYKKSGHAPPSTTTTAINYQDQDDHSIKNISTSAFPNSSCQSTLQLQKSSSLSDIFASADFSQLAHLLSEYPSNSAGLEATPSFSNANYNSQQINNCNFLQKLPQEDPSFLAMGSNQLKRQQPISEDPTDIFFQPSKKFNSSCNFTNMGSQMDTSQYQALFNHQILLNSHLEL